MENRDAALKQKAEEIRQQLEKWAQEKNILKAGEQIEFALSVKSVSTIVSKKAEDVLSLLIENIFTYERCISLGFTKYTIQDIRWLQKGDVTTVGDLLKLCMQQLEYPSTKQKKNRWIRRFNAVKKLLKSLGVTL